MSDAIILPFVPIVAFAVGALVSWLTEPKPEQALEPWAPMLRLPTKVPAPIEWPISLPTLVIEVPYV